MSRVDRAAFRPGAACSFRKGDDRMRIRELAERTGTTPETIRYYERIGLLPKAVRETNNYRRYGAEHVSRLDFIRHCRNLDIGLEEIRALLEAAVRVQMETGKVFKDGDVFAHQGVEYVVHFGPSTGIPGTSTLHLEKH